MIVYEVRCRVLRDHVTAFAAWIGPHMAEVVACDGFVGASAVQVQDPSPDEATTFVCTYRVRDRAALDAYLAGPAAALREDGVARFGDALQATRTIGPVIAEIAA